MILADLVPSGRIWIPPFPVEFSLFLPVLQVPMVANVEPPGPYGWLVVQVLLAGALELDGQSMPVVVLDLVVRQHPWALVEKAAKAAESAVAFVLFGSPRSTSVESLPFECLNSFQTRP